MQRALFPLTKTWVSQAMNVGSHKGTLAIDFGILSPYTAQEYQNLYAPFDGTVVHVDPASKGAGVAFQSDEKVQYVDGTVDYMTLWTGHDNNPPKVGTHYKQGEKYSAMGNAGGVAKQCHLEVQKGKFIMPTKYVKTDYGNVYKLDNALEPYKALFLKEGDYIKYSPYSWEVAPMTVGTPVKRNEYVDQIKVISIILNVRTKPSLKGPRLGYATPGIYNILSTATADNYTWYEIEKDKWIAYNKEWEELLPKKKSEVEILKEEISKLTDENKKLTDENKKLKDKLTQIHKLSE